MLNGSVNDHRGKTSCVSALLSEAEIATLGRPSVQAAGSSEQAQHDSKQLILRGNAEPLIGALAVGQGRMQADAERLRDRLGAETKQDVAADFLLARRQRAEWRARREQRGEVLVGRCGRGLLEMARDAGANRRRDRL